VLYINVRSFIPKYFSSDHIVMQDIKEVGQRGLRLVFEN
jgi:hypothetical protein